MKKLLKERFQELAGIKPLYTEQDSATTTTKVRLKMSNIEDQVTITEKPGKVLEDVTISWGNESHTVTFEEENKIDDHGNEGMDLEFMAESDDGKWQFILEVYAEASYPNTDPVEWDWEELIIQDHPDDESHLDPEDRSDYDPRMDPAIRSDFDDPVVEIEDDEDLTLEPEDDYVDEFELKDLTFDQIVNSFPNNYQDVHFTRKQPNGEEGPYYRDGINFPNMDDSLTHIGDANAWEDWKSKTMRHYGNVEIVLNDEGKNWFDKVFVSDDKFNDDKDSFIRGKMKALNR